MNRLKLVINNIHSNTRICVLRSQGLINLLRNNYLYEMKYFNIKITKNTLNSFNSVF